jgi:integrase
MKIKSNHFWSSESITTIKLSNGKNYSVRNNRSRYLYPDEYMAIEDIPEINKKTKILNYKFLINTGARVDEVRNIKVQDIDFDRNSIIIRKTKVKNKDGSPKIRIIPISVKFKKYLKKVVKDYNLSAQNYFPILTTAGLNISLKKSAQKAGIPDWKMISVHNMRKTLETWLIALDIDSLKITQHFGHSVAIATKHYVSPDTFTWEEKQQIRSIIGGLYGKR